MTPSPSPSMLHYRKMIKILVTALLPSLLNHGTGMATTWDDKDFFKYCPPSRCSKHGPEIRYPYRLESSNTSSTCGAPCMNSACSGQDTILAHPDLAETTTSWISETYNSITDNCTRSCEQGGRLCAFSSQSNQTFCMRHGIISIVSLFHANYDNNAVLNTPYKTT